MVVLLLAPACTPTASPPEAAVSASGRRIQPGPNVLVSGELPGWDHTEYMADADPANPGSLVVCSMYYSQDRNQLASGVYTSADGGGSWRLTLSDTTDRLDGVWDPACVFGPEGQAWFVTIAHDPTKVRDPAEGSYAAWPTPGRAIMPAYHSTDAGATWTWRHTFGFLDNEDLTIDHTDGPYRGRIYMYGNTFPWSSLWLVYSDDGGATFRQSAETKLPSGEATHAGPGAILPDGTLLLPYTVRAAGPATPGRYQIGVAASRNGGRTIDLPVTAATAASCGRVRHGVVGDPELGVGPATINLAADRSGGVHQGRAYLQWVGQDRNQCAVFVAYSDDGGRKWSDPLRISDAPLGQDPGFEVFLPQIAVNAQGVVAATWYDRREATNRKDHRLRVSASLDGGDSWLPSVAVSTHPFVFQENPEWRGTALARGGGRRSVGDAGRTDLIETMVFPGPRLHEAWNSGMGDYAAIAAGADGRFHAFWIDNRTGVAQLYTAAVEVPGAPAVNGDSALAGLANVTRTLEVQYTRSAYHSANRTLDLDLQLVNTSTDTVGGPLRMRVLGITSDIGAAELLGEDGQPRAPGAIVDLTTMLPPDGLAPGQTSGLATLRLRFGPGRPVINPRGNTDIARFRARIFGTRR